MMKPFFIAVLALAAVTALFSMVLFYLAQTSEEVYVMIHTVLAAVCLCVSFALGVVGVFGWWISRNSR